MKCPHCGYEKIQPNFNFCPRCRRPLKDQGKADKMVNSPDQQLGLLGHHDSAPETHHDGIESELQIKSPKTADHQFSRVMKYCPHCGSQTENDNMHFCPVCADGTKIIKKETIQAEEIINWNVCPRCGRYRSIMPRPFDDPNHCPNCGAAYPVFTHEVRELRKNQTREELIEQLKDISSHWVNAPFAIHRNAMCYSIAPPHEDYVKCEECGKVVEISNYLNNQHFLERIVQEINELGYDASIKGLCKECAEKRGIEPLFLSRDAHFGEVDKGQFFHLFAFKTKDKSEYTYSITNDTLDYCVFEAFLENKTTFEFDEEIIRVKDELPIIQMMSGITLSGMDTNEQKRELEDLAYKRIRPQKTERDKVKVCERCGRPVLLCHCSKIPDKEGN